MLHAIRSLRNVRIELTVGAFEVRIRDETRTAVSRASDVNDVQIKFFDEAIEMHINEVQSRRRAPVTQQARLNVLNLQPLVEQGVIEEINLSDGKIIRGAPVGVLFAELFLGYWADGCVNLPCIMRRHCNFPLFQKSHRLALTWAAIVGILATMVNRARE